MRRPGVYTRRRNVWIAGRLWLARPRRLHPAAQHLGDAPGLGDAAAGGVRLLGVEDFADAAQAGFAEMRDETVQEMPGLRRISGVDAQPGVHVRADEPAPDRPLVIGGVAGPQIAVVAGLVLRMAWGQRAQAHGSEQPLG